MPRCRKRPPSVTAASPDRFHEYLDDSNKQPRHLPKSPANTPELLKSRSIFDAKIGVALTR